MTEKSEEVVTTDLGYIAGALENDLPRLEGSSALITGGAGFLGYYMVQTLSFWNAHGASRPTEITVLDNFRRGYPEWIDQLQTDPHLRVVDHDITEPLPGGLGHHEFIIHGAGIASPGLYRQIPIETMDANVGGLRRLLDAAVRWTQAGRGIGGFLFYSSSEIYGDPVAEAIPTPETYRGNVSCTGPRACYDESKRYGETLTVNFARVHGLPATIVRPFNNYGPGMKINDGRVIADFCRSVIEDRDIVMLSDGSPTRTFCYVADAVVGYYKVLLRGRPGEAYNIGVPGPEISMADLAAKVVSAGREFLGYEGTVTLGESGETDYLIDNPTRRCPDITKATEEVGYRPSVGLDEGIRRTLHWYDGNRDEVGS
jgi:dTDP-glucose 4,6-dehydratase/UDP-glucuronate decarboxylase